MGSRGVTRVDERPPTASDGSERQRHSAARQPQRACARQRQAPLAAAARQGRFGTRRGLERAAAAAVCAFESSRARLPAV
eukprot:4732251-Prymnesium_polylepis.1